jgi:hypothetical protein
VQKSERVGRKSHLGTNWRTEIRASWSQELSWNQLAYRNQSELVARAVLEPTGVQKSERVGRKSRLGANWCAEIRASWSQELSWNQLAFRNQSELVARAILEPTGVQKSERVGCKSRLGTN